MPDFVGSLPFGAVLEDFSSLQRHCQRSAAFHKEKFPSATRISGGYSLVSTSCENRLVLGLPTFVVLQMVMPWSSAVGGLSEPA